MEERNVQDVNYEEVVNETTVSQSTEINEGGAKVVVVGEGDTGINRAMKLLNTKSVLDSYVNTKSEIHELQRQVVNNEEIIVALEEKISNLSLEEIQNIPLDKVDEFFIINGTEIEFNMEFDDSEKSTLMKKDYLIYMKESSEALKNIDNAITELDTELKNNEDELQQIINQYGDMTNLIRLKMQEDFDNSTDPDKKRRYGIILSSFDDALSLDRIYEQYKNLKSSNTIKDYQANYRAGKIYRDYLTALKKLNIKNDLTVFDTLETKFLPEKYHKYPNLFLFAVIRFIAYRKNIVSRNNEGVFLSQLSVYVKELYNKTLKEETKEAFLLNIQKVLDLFI